MNVVFNCLLLDLRSKKKFKWTCLSFWKRGIKCDLYRKIFISFDLDWLILTLPCSIDDNFFSPKKILIRKDRFRFAIAFYELLIEYRFKNLFRIIFSTISKRYNFSVKMCIVFKSSNMMWACASVVNWIMHYFQGEVRT